LGFWLLAAATDGTLCTFSSSYFIISIKKGNVVYMFLHQQQQQQQLFFFWHGWYKYWSAPIISCRHQNQNQQKTPAADFHT
jgi:hypothetical protein